MGGEEGGEGEEGKRRGFMRKGYRLAGRPREPRASVAWFLAKMLRPHLDASLSVSCVAVCALLYACMLPSICFLASSDVTALRRR